MVIPKGFCYAMHESLVEAIENAKKLLENGNETSIEEAIEAMQNAKSDLIEKGDSTELSETIESSKEVDESDYTDESVKMLENAIAEAEEVISDENATQEDVDAALAKLNEAYEALVNIASLKEVIDRVDDTDTSIYTDESVEAFVEAYNKACAALVNGTHESVKIAEAELVEAYEALTEKTVEENEEIVEDPENDLEEESDDETTEGSNTGDTTNVTLLLAMLLASAYVLFRRKKA